MLVDDAVVLQINVEIFLSMSGCADTCSFFGQLKRLRGFRHAQKEIFSSFCAIQTFKASYFLDYVKRFPCASNVD
jgi:hypothetical protein